MKRQISYLDKYINYYIKGQGDALVLLHGFMEDAHMWKTLSEALSNEYHPQR